MYTPTERVFAAVAYLPIIGWIIALFAAPRSEFVQFHARQSFGLFVFLSGSLAIWIIITWLLSWIPFGMLVGVVLFTLVLTAILVGIVAWIIGIVRALLGQVALLPVFGGAANRIGF